MHKHTLNLLGITLVAGCALISTKCHAQTTKSNSDSTNNSIATISTPISTTDKSIVSDKTTISESTKNISSSHTKIAPVISNPRIAIPSRIFFAPSMQQ